MVASLGALLGLAKTEESKGDLPEARHRGPQGARARGLPNATGTDHGCARKDEELQAQLRELWKSWLEAQDLGEPDLLHKAERQPRYLMLLRAMLQAADDPDSDFLRRAEEGLPLGILEKLPRTPHVFEEQTKWPLENALGGGASVGT